MIKDRRMCFKISINKHLPIHYKHLKANRKFHARLLHNMVTFIGTCDTQ